MRTNAAHKANGASEETLDGVRLASEKQKAEVEKLEAELKGLRGEFAIQRGLSHLAFSPDGQLISGMADGKVRIWDAGSGLEVVSPTKVVWDLVRAADKPAVQGPMAERIAKWLDQEIDCKLSPDNALRLEDVFELVFKKSGHEIPVRMMHQTEDHQYRNNLRGTIQIGALLQAILDGSNEELPGQNLAFVIRDYGLLVTSKDRVPDGAVQVLDFWKAKGEKKAEPPKK